MFTSKDNSFEGNFNGIETDDKKKLAMEKEDDTSVNYCMNEKSGQLLGRSFSSLFKIVLYMISFCAVLAIFWGLCLTVFYQFLDNYEPKLQQDSSYIGHNPGLGYRPMMKDENPYSSLLWFKHGASGDWDRFKENLDEFLVEYEPGYWANAGAVLTKCFFTDGPLNEEKTCEFNKEWLSDQNSDYKCITEESYGYLHGKPCILVKLNRIYGWNPIPYYNITEVNSLVDMPDRLKKHITQVWTENCKGKSKGILFAFKQYVTKNIFQFLFHKPFHFLFSICNLNLFFMQTLKTNVHNSIWSGFIVMAKIILIRRTSDPFLTRHGEDFLDTFSHISTK